MGPNRQRRPQQVRGRGRGGRGRGGAPAPAANAAPSMMSTAGREMVIDVLHHAATGGSVPVPEKHFDANGSARITLQRNAPLTPTDVLQRLFEGLGFPRDLVSQYMADLAQTSAVPVFSDVSELLGAASPFQPFMIQCCFELFNCMVWYHRTEGAAAEAEAEAEAAVGDEAEGDAVLLEEIETLRSLFSDALIGEKNFEDAATENRELYFRFLTEKQDPVLLVVRLPDYYPAETPSIFLQPVKGPVAGGALPAMALLPNCTRELTAPSRRAVMDTAVDTINSFVGSGCLMALVSAVAGAIAAISDAGQEVSAAAAASEAEERRRERQAQADQRKAFVGALTGKGDAKDDDDGEDRFIKVQMPERVELATVEDTNRMDEGVRRTFLHRDKKLDEELRQEWAELREKGSLRKQREGLPAHAVREELRAALAAHNVVVIGGETGSGKTTQIPQYVYEFMCEEGRGSEANVVCTQPRRLAATSVALRVAEERDEAVGGRVGYTIRLENCVSKRTQLTYCTTGIVLRRLQADKFLGNVSHVIVDEIHERGVDTDFLLILLRDLVTRRSDLKVILMSATMDSELFSRYFGGSPTIGIKGRTFPVRVLHLEQLLPEVHYVVEDGSPYARPSANTEARRRNTRKNMFSLDLAEVDEDAEDAARHKALAKTVNASAQTLDTISRMNLEVINYELIEAVVVYIDTSLRIDGAVLIFLPGMAEIQRCMEQLKSNPGLAHSCVLYNLHSSLGSAEQQSVFKRPPKGKRKVIIGTNIMETSVTIDDAVFVIDTGKAKENRYNARKSLSELVTVDIAKANCRQRQGRAGRVREGFCFRLFTEAQYEAFDDHQLCEMHRVPLESLILQIYALHLGDEVEYLRKALTPPEERAIHSSVKVLTTLGALTAEKRLTSLGLHLANLPLDVRVGKMIIHGALLQCLDPVLTIAACLASRPPFIASVDFRNEVESVRRAFAGEYFSDHLASWFAYARWVAADKTKGPAAGRKVCQECFLAPAALQQLRSTKMQYERYLVDGGFLELQGSDGRQGGASRPNRFAFGVYETLEGSVYEAGGAYYNANSGSVRCVLACLVAGLYPNVASRKGGAAKKHHHGGAPQRYHTFDGSECLIHPSSVAGRESQLPSSLVVYVDKIKTSCIFLREVSPVSPLHIILFCGGELQYVERYGELCVDERTAFACKQEDATLLIHIKQQFDSALRTKINNPAQSWEQISSVVVRAIVRLLRDDAGSKLRIIDRNAPRAPLTANLAAEDGAGSALPSNVLEVAEQPFKTSKSCFLCGQTGHVSRYCPHNASQKGGGPPVRCFICGEWHYPQDCPVPVPYKP